MNDTMKDGPNITRIAALIGDQARADVLTALMADRALTATELTAIAGVTKQTMSAHLAKLQDAGLLQVNAQGRHRYFKLANQDVAQLLESLMNVAFRTGAVRLRSSPREPALRKARVCYDHLAGELGVLAFESLCQHKHLQTRQGELCLTRKGLQWFEQLGVNVDDAMNKKRHFCKHCMDWSERRHHLAGALGHALLEQIYALGWAKPQRGSRVVQFTDKGEYDFRRTFLKAA